MNYTNFNECQIWNHRGQSNIIVTYKQQHRQKYYNSKIIPINGDNK